MKGRTVNLGKYCLLKVQLKEGELSPFWLAVRQKFLFTGEKAINNLQALTTTYLCKCCLVNGDLQTFEEVIIRSLDGT